MAKNQILIDFDNTLFDTESFKKELAKKGELKDLSMFVYPDVTRFIDYAKIYGVPILFTEGDLSLQKEKILKSGIDELFGTVKVFDSYTKIENLKKDFQVGSTVIIDDKPDFVKDAFAFGFKVIRVKRGKYSNVIADVPEDFVAESLDEIIEKDLIRKILNLLQN